MKTVDFSSISVKYGQLVLFVFTILLLLIDIIFLIFNFSSSLLLVFPIHAAVTFLINFFLGKLYKIRIIDLVINIENMWNKNTYPLSDLTDIKLLHFTLPFPFNPYGKFILKNEQKITMVFSNRFKIYLSKGGMYLYLVNLKKLLIGG